MTKLAWSCDERDRKNCRNPHGCHCREITNLLAARQQGEDAAYYRWIDRLIAEKRRQFRVGVSSPLKQGEG